MKGYKIGKIAGIRIEIDPSWFFIFFLVTFNLALGLFPQIHPEWNPMLSLTISILTSLLFFASVLTHELAHSLVARVRGLPVKRITLFLFGGVSNIEREPQSAKTEFLVAIVGPLTSIVLGLIFLTIGGVGNNPIQTIFLWLGPINILLGIFNLVPGFPLDGGRILRSFIWSLTNNLSFSTQIAAGAGQLIGWGFILLGMSMVLGIEIPFFGSGLASGIWIAFIGWFLNSAASSSAEQTIIAEILKNVTVGKIMHRKIMPAPSYLPLEKFVNDYVIGTDSHIFSVKRNSHIEGVISLEDIERVPREEWPKRTVEEVMVPYARLEKISERENAANAFQKFRKTDANELPVVRDGRIIGMLTRKDIVLWLNLKMKRTQRN